MRLKNEIDEKKKIIEEGWSPVGLETSPNIAEVKQRLMAMVALVLEKIYVLEYINEYIYEVLTTCPLHKTEKGVVVGEKEHCKFQYSKKMLESVKDYVAARLEGLVRKKIQSGLWTYIDVMAGLCQLYREMLTGQKIDYEHWLKKIVTKRALMLPKKYFKQLQKEVILPNGTYDKDCFMINDKKELELQKGLFEKYLFLVQKESKKKHPGCWARFAKGTQYSVLQESINAFLQGANAKRQEKWKN